MLTDRQVQAAIRNAKEEITLNDGSRAKGQGSLRLRIRPGTRGTTATWMAWWQQDGKRATMTLGTYPDMPLVDARNAFDAKVGQPLAAGVDPRHVPEAVEMPTIKRLADAYVAAMRADGKSSAGEVENSLRRFIDHAGEDTEAGAVTSTQVSDFLRAIYQGGARTMADRMRAYLSAMFNYGIKAANDYRAEKRVDWGIASNPVTGIPRDVEANQARERNLSADELADVWHGVDGPGFALETRACIKILIGCGQRVLETLRIDGREIDLDAMVWNMPREKTKGKKRPHTIPLPHQLKPVFQALKAKRGDGPLFPARAGESLTQKCTSINKALARWREGRDMEAFTPRDIRRTWKSRAHDAGVDRFTRDLIQQHAKGDTGSKHYDRAEYLPQMRAAMDKWEVWLDDNVVNKQQLAKAA